VRATDTRDAVLASFDEARASFADQLAAAPEESLRYLKPGDDYALGGLVFHVNAVLEHYLGALEALVSSGFRETGTADRPGLFEEASARARAGLTARELAAALAMTQELHGAVSAKIGSLPAEGFERKAPVTYEAGAEPYPTSAAAVAGWLTDHYREHVAQIRQLLDDWRSSR
jgi:hypothetical protein